MVKELAINGGKPIRDKMLPYGHQWIDQDDIKAVSEVLQSDWITQGPKVEEFEESFATYIGARYAIAVNSGTAALHTACFAARISKGDKVIITPITFVASANCVIYQGGIPIFADINENTVNIDPEEIKKKITSDTRAIIPVDFTGLPVDLEEIIQIAKRNNLVVIEDASHALGATYKRSKIGNISDMTIFSFHPVKHICTGEGGAVLTNDKSVAEHIRLLRSHGIHRPGLPEQPAWFYEQIELGWNYRLTEMQAALGVSQLKRLPQFITRRRQIAQRYYEELNKAPFDHVFSLPVDDPGHVYHLFAIQCKASTVRDDLHRFLKEKNIMTQIHYIPVYKHPYYERRFGKIRLPGAEAYFKGCLSIPIYPKMTEADQDRVIAALTTFCTQG